MLNTFNDQSPLRITTKLQNSILSPNKKSQRRISTGVRRRTSKFDSPIRQRERIRVTKLLVAFPEKNRRQDRPAAVRVTAEGVKDRVGYVGSRTIVLHGPFRIEHGRDSCGNRFPGARSYY